MNPLTQIKNTQKVTKAEIGAPGYCALLTAAAQPPAALQPWHAVQMVLAGRTCRHTPLCLSQPPAAAAACCRRRRCLPECRPRAPPCPELGLTDKASWHDRYKHSAYVFAGGLPFELTEGDLLAVFAQVWWAGALQVGQLV